MNVLSLSKSVFVAVSQAAPLICLKILDRRSNTADLSCCRSLPAIKKFLWFDDRYRTFAGTLQARHFTLDAC